MDRYPSSDSTIRRFAEIGVGAGIAGALASLFGGESVNGPGLWASGILFIVGLIGVIADQQSIRHRDSRAWTTDEWNQVRDTDYRRREGIFLIHSATPTRPPADTDHPDKQWWKVRVQLAQHGTGPLSEGKIKEVEYHFGEKFTETPVRVQHPKDSFAREDELYGPLLVLARVIFVNPNKRPLLVERYINLPPSAATDTQS